MSLIKNILKAIIAAGLTAGFVSQACATVVFNWVPTAGDTREQKITVSDALYLQAQSGVVNFFGFNADNGRPPETGTPAITTWQSRLTGLTPDTSFDTMLLRTEGGVLETISTSVAQSVCATAFRCIFQSASSSSSTFQGVINLSSLSASRVTSLLSLSGNVLAVDIFLSETNSNPNRVEVRTTSWAFTTGGPSSTGSWQIDRRTIPTTPVPTPSSLLLVLAGIGAVFRRKQSA